MSITRRVMTALEGLLSGGQVDTRLAAIATAMGGSLFVGTLSADPEATLVNTTDADASLVLGGVYRYGYKLFRYVKFVDAVAYADGQVVFGDPGGPTQVTNDISNSVHATVPVPVGVAIGIQTENKHGFVLIYGDVTLITSGEDDIASGEVLYATAADAGPVDSAVLGRPVGYALAADNDGANTVSAMVCLAGGF